MTEYEFWSKNVRKCDHNSTMIYLANFKKIVIRCLKNGWLKHDLFIGFKVTKREVERVALTKSEVDRIASEHFEMQSTSNVRDIFLFSCYTGLAYADVEKLRKIDIVTGNDGGQWLISRRQKTDITARIPLFPDALSLISKHAKHPKCIAKNLVLPVLTNQKMNDYFKIICNIARDDMKANGFSRLVLHRRSHHDHDRHYHCDHARHNQGHLYHPDVYLLLLIFYRAHYYHSNFPVCLIAVPPLYVP